MSTDGQAMDASNALPKETDDHSLLSKPINVGISGIQHVVHCLQRGTPEIKDLLLNECNLIYECKVCMSLHRSLVNFLAHKRTYCKQHICETMMLFHADHIEKETIIVQPEDPDSERSPPRDTFMCEVDHLEYNEQVEVGLQAPATILQPLHHSPKKITSAVRMLQPPMPLCSTEVPGSVDHLMRRRVVPSVKEPAEELALERIPSNPNAMFQRRIGEMKQESELNGDMNAPDETDENSGSSQVSSSGTSLHLDRLRDRTDCDIPSKTCLVCNTRYVSLKTLSFHMRNIHATVRTYYQCPYCEASFSQSWGVTRHLMQVHKKSRSQVTNMKLDTRRKTVNKVEEPTTEDDRLKSAAPGVSGMSKTKKGGYNLFPCKNCGRIFTFKAGMAGHMSHCLRKKSGGGAGSGLKVSNVSRVSKNSTSIPSPPICTPPPPLVPSVATRPKRLVKKKDTGDFVSGGRRVSTSPKKPQKSEISVPKSKNATKGLCVEDIGSIISEQKLKCLKCVRKFSSISNLRRHSAIHIGRNRYKCHYCEYQSYTRSDCRNHLKRVHFEVRSSLSELDKLVLDLSPPPPKSVNKKSSRATSSSPPSKAGSCSKKIPLLESSTKSSKAKASPKALVPITSRSPKKVAEGSPKKVAEAKRPRLPLSPSKVSADIMLTTLVTRASSYVKPNIAMHILRREKEKAPEPAKKKAKTTHGSGSKDKVTKSKVKDTKVKVENGDVAEKDCEPVDNVVMEDLVIESCIVQEDCAQGCDEFVADLVGLDTLHNDLDDDWSTVVSE